MNAKVGNDNLDGEKVIIKHGLDTITENGELLVDCCADSDLVIGGTLFAHKTSILYYLELHKC